MKRIMIGAAIIGVVVLLAAGVFTAVQLLTPQETEAASGGNGRTIQSVQAVNGGAPVAVNTTILPADELPDEPSAAFGIFKSREDDVLIMGTGTIDLEVDVDVNGDTGQETTTLLPTTDGPDVEVVVTADTLIYRDVTDLTMTGPVESGERTVKQTVRAVDSADDIGDNSELEVWGEKRGDRIVATVLVFGPLAGGAFE